MIILCILDGWGIREPSDDNAIAQTPTPHWDFLCDTGVRAELQASEHFVGLPDKQIGNSEVGHANIGCGRVLLQDLPRIDAAIKSGEHVGNTALRDAITALKQSGGRAHLIGLLSDGGVHAHQHHIQSYANLLHENGIATCVHAITDGRDTAPDCAADMIKAFHAACPQVPIATVSGRFYAMDRDNNVNRTQQAYDAIVSGQGARFDSAVDAVAHFHGSDIFDEFIPPSVIGEATSIQDGDGVFFMNFRADRMRALANMIVGIGDNAPPVNLVAKVGLVEYSNELNEHLQTLFPAEPVRESLGEVVSLAGKKQLRIAETEKYAHVTYFFNGNYEPPFDGEERVLIPSPKVQRYDLQPEMSAYEVWEKLSAAIASGKYELLVVNFANPDMVGHTGNFAAAQKAVAVIDDILGKLSQAARQHSAILLVTADHGNIEMMVDPKTGKRHTAHTTNPVPLVMMGHNRQLQNGSLCDIAPTILDLMGLEKPQQMSGHSLIIT